MEAAEVPEKCADPVVLGLVPALEAVLFASPEPLSLAALSTVFGVKGTEPESADVRPKDGSAQDEAGKTASESDAGLPSAASTYVIRPTVEQLKSGLAELARRTGAPDRGVVLLEVAGGWQFLTRDTYFPSVQKIAKTRAEEKLSPATIETLSVVAYKQPVTRAEVDAIRGAQSGPHLRTLMDKGMVRVVGRAEIPGAPFTYGTTKHFLKHFGLKSPKDLPDPKDLSRVLAEQGRTTGRTP